MSLGDPCPQPTQLNASMLHSCTNATKLDYFDGSRAGFGIFVIVMFLFPVGKYRHGLAVFLPGKNSDLNVKHLIVFLYSEFSGGLYGGVSKKVSLQEVPKKKESWWQNRWAGFGTQWYEIKIRFKRKSFKRYLFAVSIVGLDQCQFMSSAMIYVSLKNEPVVWI